MDNLDEILTLLSKKTGKTVDELKIAVEKNDFNSIITALPVGQQQFARMVLRDPKLQQKLMRNFNIGGMPK